jgi:hypothetical protein
VRRQHQVGDGQALAGEEGVRSQQPVELGDADPPSGSAAARAYTCG